MRFLLSYISLLPFALSASLTLYIPPSQRLPNPATLPASTHATLYAQGRPYTAHLTRKNTFEFEGLDPGSYLATVHCRDYLFSPLRVDVTASVAADGTKGTEKVAVWGTFRGHEWDNKGEKRGEGMGDLTVELGVGPAKDYYQVRQGCEYIGNEESLENQV